jgi:hypothetical protein
VRTKGKNIATGYVPLGVGYVPTAPEETVLSSRFLFEFIHSPFSVGVPGPAPHNKSFIEVILVTNRFYITNDGS